MSLGDLSGDLKKIEAGLQNFARQFLRKASTQVAARSVSKYMRDTGGNEGRRAPDDSGPLRIVSGRLARSLSTRGRIADTGGSAEGIDKIQVAGEIVRLIKGSKVEYAAVHEHGFRGTQRVPQHTRTITQAFGRPISPREVTVRAHTRNMAIAKRAYLEPALQDKLPQLQKMAEDDLLKFITRALT